MAAREHQKVCDVKQSVKTIPFITGEITLRQHVCELFFGVNIFDLVSGVQIDYVTQPIKRDSLGSGHVSHRSTSAFNDHFDHSFIIFKNVKLGLEVRRFCVCDDVIHIE